MQTHLYIFAFFSGMFGIDTCSWLKLDLLANSGWEAIVTTLLENFQVFITHEVKKEVIHFLTHRNIWFNKIIILPSDPNIFEKYVGEVFDPADASLLSLINDKSVVIITEDPTMLVECVSTRNNVIQMIDLLFLLYKDNYISKNDLIKLITFFRKNRNIKLRKANTIKNKL